MHRKRAPKGARGVSGEGNRRNGINGAMTIRPKRSEGRIGRNREAIAAPKGRGA